MKQVTILLLFLATLTAWGQNGTYLDRISGKLRYIRPDGVASDVKVDSSAVLNLGKKLATQDQIIGRNSISVDLGLLPPLGYFYMRNPSGANPQLLDNGGNTLPLTPTFKNVTDFDNCVLPTGVYDGSVWRRVQVTPALTAIYSTTAVGYQTMFTTPVNGYCFERTYNGAVEMKWFGAKADLDLPTGYTTWESMTPAQQTPFVNNRIAIQKGLDYVATIIQPTKYGAYSLYRNREAEIIFSTGKYCIGGGSVKPYGAIIISGRGRESYSGTVVQQLTSNVDLFEQKESDDFSSASIHIRDICLTNIGTSGNGALYKSRSYTASHNTLIFERVWFQGASYVAVWIYKANDVRIFDCTFDGMSGRGWILGDNTVAAYEVTEAKIIRNTIYWCQAGIGEVRNVRGLLFQSNTVDNIPNGVTIPGIDANTNTFRHDRLHIQNNTFNKVSPVLVAKAGTALKVTGNTATDLSGPFVWFSGAATFKNADFSLNTLYGVWPSGTAAFYSPVTPIQNSQFLGNIVVDSTNSSVNAFYLQNFYTTGNDINSKLVSGFSNPYAVMHPGQNGISASNTNYITSGNIQTMNLKSGVHRAGSAVTGLPFAGDWVLNVSHNEDSDYAGGGPYWNASISPLGFPNLVYQGGLSNTTFSGWTQMVTQNFNNDLTLTSSTNRVLGVTTGFNTGHMFSLYFGGVNNRIENGFGLPSVQNWFHGTIIQNAVSSASGPALTVKGLTAAQNIMSAQNSGGTTVFSLNQNGLLSSTGLTATDGTKGLILKASDGAGCYRITVNNAGVLSTTSVTCP